MKFAAFWQGRFTWTAKRRLKSIALSALRFWWRRRFWRSGWRSCGSLCFSHRPELHHFSFECAVSIPPIRAAGFFVLGDVLHRRSLCTLGNGSLVSDCKGARLLFTCDRERLRILIHRRDHSVKRKWACALLRSRTGRWSSRFWRGRRWTRCAGRLCASQCAKGNSNNADAAHEAGFGLHSLGPYWIRRSLQISVGGLDPVQPSSTV